MGPAFAIDRTPVKCNTKTVSDVLSRQAVALPETVAFLETVESRYSQERTWPIVLELEVFIRKLASIN